MPVTDISSKSNGIGLSLLRTCASAQVGNVTVVPTLPAKIWIAGYGINLTDL